MLAEKEAALTKQHEDQQAALALEKQKIEEQLAARVAAVAASEAEIQQRNAEIAEAQKNLEAVAQARIVELDEEFRRRKDAWKAEFDARNAGLEKQLREKLATDEQSVMASLEQQQKNLDEQLTEKAVEWEKLDRELAERAEAIVLKEESLAIRETEIAEKEQDLVTRINEGEEFLKFQTELSEKLKDQIREMQTIIDIGEGIQSISELDPDSPSALEETNAALEQGAEVPLQESPAADDAANIDPPATTDPDDDSTTNPDGAASPDVAGDGG